jgi:predicted DCC family thiol-disulfide oxidoreductase YuxK
MEKKDLQVFFDGECPLCMREIRMLQRRDRSGRVDFVDISATDFSAEALGKTQSEMMARIHGRLPNGNWIEGVEVFRQLYDAVGFGALVRFSRWPGISQALDFSYSQFASQRLRLTGRCSADTCKIEAPRMMRGEPRTGPVS